jgi:hypothetical protein
MGRARDTDLHLGARGGARWYTPAILRRLRMRMDLLPGCLAKRRDIGLDVFAGGRAGAGPSDLCARNIPPADSSLPFSLLPRYYSLLPR